MEVYYYLLPVHIHEAERCIAYIQSSKAAIVNLVQALSEEWKSYNIKINCINPERTKTPMRIQNFGIEPENSLLSPQFVAETSIMTLLSGLTGQVIDVRRKTD